MRYILSFFLLSFSAYSQTVTFGVKGGVPFGQPTADYGHLNVDSGHWLVGPAVEFHLPYRVSFEAAALYSSYTVRYQSDVSFASTDAFPFFRITGRGETKAWDFPGFIKYRFRNDGFNPFVLGGINYRRENSDVRVTCARSDGGDCGPSITFTQRYSTSQDRLGPALGGGVEWRFGRIRVAPEFRYTHLNRPGANQYNLLFGISL